MMTKAEREELRKWRVSAFRKQRRLKIAMEVLQGIADGHACYTPGCACHTPLTDHESWTEYCDVGNAKVALKLIREVKA